jgi:hypothetical protein
MKLDGPPGSMSEDTGDSSDAGAGVSASEPAPPRPPLVLPTVLGVVALEPDLGPAGGLGVHCTRTWGVCRAGAGRVGLDAGGRVGACA